MDRDEFIEAVRRRAILGSREEAERISRATLETLAERLTGEEVEDLAALLPQELAGCLLWHERAGSGEAFALDEFVDRVVEREDARDPAEAASHAKAVMRAVKEAVAAGEEKDARSPLPQELAPLSEPGVGESGLPGAGG